MMQLSEETKRKLLSEAERMLDYSYCPYSGFAVGAALLAKSGKIFTGCNIENAAFSPTNCAERTAFFKAVSEGETEFEAIAVIGGKNRIAGDACPPCGVCRQVMMEFCDPESFLILTKGSSGIIEKGLGEYLPDGFGPSQLKR
jgi:cytidine deaminase